MATVHDAKEVLREAEQALQKLIENALDNQQYEDVAAIAAIADDLARLRNAREKQAEHGKRADQQTPIKFKKERPRRESRAKKRTKTKSKIASQPGRNQKQYPQFVNDGDRLVKIGWSKKNKGAYEHRAPKESVIAFLRHLMANVSEGKLFTMDGLLPANDPSTGSEIPAYQAYMTIAWLRGTDVIERKGRDGYVLLRNMSKKVELEELWDTLPAR